MASSNGRVAKCDFCFFYFKVGFQVTEISGFQMTDWWEFGGFQVVVKKKLAQALSIMLYYMQTKSQHSEEAMK